MILCWFVHQRNYPRRAGAAAPRQIKVTRKHFCNFAMVSQMSWEAFPAAIHPAASRGFAPPVLPPFWCPCSFYKKERNAHSPKVLSNTVKTLAMVYSLIASRRSIQRLVLAYLKFRPE